MNIKIILIILAFVVFLLISPKYEYMSVGHANSIVNNKSSFSNYKTVKKKLPWLDPVQYDESKELIKKKLFNVNAVMKIN